MTTELKHPKDKYLFVEHIPHIWCPGCGIGTAMNCLIQAISEMDTPLEDYSVVSGIGCSSRIAGYLKMDSFHTTHGRAIPFATGLKLANPKLKVFVFAGDGDLFSIGGNHFIHAARRNVDLTVICINNFNYGMTGGQAGPTTPLNAKTSTTPFGAFEQPFNLPYVAAASGAVYVARWTVLHVRRLVKSIKRAFEKKGFTFVEIISPCPTNFGRKNKYGTGVNTLKYYAENTEIKHDINPAEAPIELGGKFIVGEFIDVDKLSFRQIRQERLSSIFPKPKEVYENNGNNMY